MSTSKIKKFTIEGVLTTTSPLHITQPGEAHWNPGGGWNGRGGFTKHGSGFPVTMTRSASVFLSRTSKTEDMEEDERADQGVSYRDQVPVIPATTWRGMLRRGAASIIEDHVIGKLNTKLSFDAYQGLHCGAISGNPDGVPPTTDEIRTARAHVFYGIFGGGPRLLQGALRASDSLPVISGIIEANLLPGRLSDKALKGVHPRNLYSVLPVLRKDDFSGDHFGASRAAEVVENFSETYDIERTKRVQAAKDGLDGKKEGKDRGVRGMSFREDVVTGVPFNVRLELNGTPAQAGMIIAALERRLNIGVGGRTALGFGRLDGTLELVDEAGKRVEVLSVTDGTTQFLPGSDPYIDAMSDAVSELSMDDINRYMTSALSADDKAAKAAKKAKK